LRICSSPNFLACPHRSPWEFVTGLSGVFHFAEVMYHVNLTDNPEDASHISDEDVGVVSDMIPFGVMSRAVLTLGEVWIAHFYIYN